MGLLTDYVKYREKQKVDKKQAELNIFSNVIENPGNYSQQDVDYAWNRLGLENEPIAQPYKQKIQQTQAHKALLPMLMHAIIGKRQKQNNGAQPQQLGQPQPQQGQQQPQQTATPVPNSSPAPWAQPKQQPQAQGAPTAQPGQQPTMQLGKRQHLAGLTPEEAQQRADTAEEHKQGIANRYATDRLAAELQVKQLFEQAQTLQEKKRADAQYQETLQAIGTQPGLSEDQRGELTREAFESHFGLKRPTTPAASFRMQEVYVKQPDGQVTPVLAQQYEPGKFKRLTGAEIDPASIVPKPDKEKQEGLTGEAKDYAWAQSHKDSKDPVERDTSAAIIKKWNLEQQNRSGMIGVREAGIPGAMGSPSSSPVGERPVDRLNKVQQGAVDTALNSLSGAITLGFGGAMRAQANEGLRLIREVTGLSPEELDARSERRKTAKTAMNRLKPLASSNEALENALTRHGQVLEAARAKLPDSAVTFISKWLQTGAINFPITSARSEGLPEAAIQYGLAMQAVRNEYARVIAGGAASAAQTPVEAMRDAGSLMSTGFSKGEVSAMLGQMQTEAKQKIGGYQDQLSELQAELSQSLVPELYGQTYQGTSSTPKPATQSRTIVQFSPSTKQYRYSNDGGKTWQAGKPPSQ